MREARGDVLPELSQSFSFGPRLEKPIGLKEC